MSCLSNCSLIFYSKKNAQINARNASLKIIALNAKKESQIMEFVPVQLISIWII